MEAIVLPLALRCISVQVSGPERDLCFVIYGLNDFPHQPTVLPVVALK